MLMDGFFFSDLLRSPPPYELGLALLFSSSTVEGGFLFSLFPGDTFSIGSRFVKTGDKVFVSSFSSLLREWRWVLDEWLPLPPLFNSPPLTPSVLEK